MDERRRGYSILPAVLGAALLAILIGAALAPNTGLVAASSNCSVYNNCPSSSPAFPWWVVAVVVLIVAAALIAALLLMRRRRPPSSAPMTPWKEAPPATPPGAAPPPPPGAAAYLETPEDVGHAPPEVAAVSAGAAGAAAGAGAAAAAPGAEGEPDIDSLMAELDKISGEILKRPPKKGAGEETPEGSEDQAQ